MYTIKNLETQITNKLDCQNFYSKFYYRCKEKKNLILIDADKKQFKLNNSEKIPLGISLNNKTALIQHCRFNDLKLETILPFNNSTSNMEIVNKIKDSLINTNKSNTLNLLNPVKGGFLARYKNINGFLPKSQVVQIIKDFLKENTKKSKPLANQLYLTNLHKKNSILKPKFSFKISNINITPYFIKKNFASSKDEHIFEGTLNFVFIYKKQA
jgi:hypothetical protein